MKFKVDGRELNAENIRIGEACEAEKALGLDMSSGTSAALAVTLFVALRRADPEKHVVQIADEVMNADMTSFDVGDASPPAVAPEEGADFQTDRNGQQTTGLPHSVPSV